MHPRLEIKSCQVGSAGNSFIDQFFEISPEDGKYIGAYFRFRPRGDLFSRVSFKPGVPTWGNSPPPYGGISGLQGEMVEFADSVIHFT